MANKNATTDETQPTTEERLAAALEAIARLQVGNQQVQREQLRQTEAKSVFAPKISAFNPRGEKDYPMADLKCHVDAPFPLRPNGQHGLDREEVDLMNLTMPGAYHVELNDGTLQPVLITGHINRATGKVDSMRWSGPLDEDNGHPTPLFTNETRQRFPALRVMLRQILGDPTSFTNEAFAAKYGKEDSPALDVMPIAIEKRKVAQFLAAKTDEAREAAVAAGALPVSVGAGAFRA